MSKTAELLAENFTPRDKDGFVILVPTAQGKKALEVHQAKTSKKNIVTSIHTPTLEPVQKDEEKVEEEESDSINLQDIEEMLGTVTEKVKGGKFKKALKHRNQEQVEALINLFSDIEEDAPDFPKVCDLITDLLRIGKTFYEYSDGMEFIDNVTYDGLIARYRALGLTEPQEYVPVDKPNKKKVNVKYPLLHNTMDKAYAIRSGDPIPAGVKESDRVEDFLKRVYSKNGLKPTTEIELEISPKIDGVSVNGTVENTTDDGTVLVSPQTRGDETESLNIIGLDGLSIGGSVTDGTFGLQYEAFVTNEDRLKASEYLGLETPYVSNRHAAAGIINRLCNGEDDELLMFLSMYPIESSGLEGTYVERMDLLSEYGIIPKDMIPRKIIKGNMEELLNKIEKRFSKISSIREKLSYAIDGIVITVVDDEYQKELGRNGRTNLYQLALKFDPASANAVVSRIHLDSGKKGFRTIQVDLEHPVFLDGVRYDHVPVLSAQLFEDLKLRKGSVVNVHRVGDVIPAITMVSAGNGAPIELPERCPYCNNKLKIKNKKLYCEDVFCSGNLAGRILGFFEAIGLDGYGKKFVDQIIEIFRYTIDPLVYLYSLKDLFDLTPEKFEKAGIKTKLAKEFHESLIKAVARTVDYKILGGVGIPDMGPARAKTILKFYKSWDKFMQDIKTGVDNITPAFGKTYKGYMSTLNMAYFMFVDPLTSSRIREDLVAINRYMRTFTKDFEHLVTIGHTGGNLSPKALEVCKKRGYEVTDTKKFDILITGSKESTSAKMKGAMKKGIPIYTDKEFIDLYDQ